MEASFRVTGRAAEIWHPETGSTELASYTIENGVTRVPLHLVSNDAVFVVFRNKTNEKSFSVNNPVERQLAQVTGPWNVTFQADRGAPEKIMLESLTPWNENADMGIKYFSGTGTYSKTIQVASVWLTKGNQIWLDLGSVKNLAEVVVNGKSLGVVWKTPFRVNVTESLKPGENSLEIKVTDLWVNRLIGDVQPDVIYDEKIQRTDAPSRNSWRNTRRWG